MTNRDTLELLKLVLENKDRFSGGLCSWVYILYDWGIISAIEHEKLRRFLKNNLPPKMFQSCYCWERGLIEPRLEWLNKQIKKYS